MAQTLPISAEQPLDATRKAAGQVVTLAGAQAVAVQAAASLTLAALLWPLIPAAHAVADLASALGPWLPLRPLPEQQVVVMPGSGGAGRAATVPGGPPGAVRAAGAITLGVEEEFVLLDPSTGATVLAGPELVRMLGGEPGIQQELMRFQVETGTTVCTSLDEAGRELIRLRRLAAAAAASLGCRLVASGVAPYRTPGLAAVTGQPRYRELARRYGPGGGRGRHLRLPRARRGPLPGGGRPGAGAAAALAGAAARRLRQLPDRRRARYRMGQLAVCDPVTLADRDPARGVAGRGRLRRGGPPPHRARGGAGRAERLLPGPAVPALPDRGGPGRRRLPRRRHRGAAGGADPRPGRHRPGRGPPRDAAGSRRRPGRSPRRWPPRRGTGSPGQEPTRSPGSPPMRRRSAPACSIMSTPRSATTATPRRSPRCCTGSMTGGPEPTASEPCSPAVYPRPRSSPHSPARRCPATSRAASGPMPGSRQRQARSRGSEEEQYRILRPSPEALAAKAVVPCQ